MNKDIKSLIETAMGFLTVIALFAGSLIFIYFIGK